MSDKDEEVAMEEEEMEGDVDVGEDEADVGEGDADKGEEEAGEEAAEGEEGGEGEERWGYGEDAAEGGEGWEEGGDQAEGEGEGEEGEGEYAEGEGEEGGEEGGEGEGGEEGEGEYAEGEYAEGEEGGGEYAEGEYAEGEGEEGGEGEAAAEGEGGDDEIEQMSSEELQKEIFKVKRQIRRLESEIEKEDEEDDGYEIELFDIPPHCVPIRCDVRYFDWEALAKEVQFDVIVMDPPWQLAGAAPTRGVALGYKQLHNKDIANMPIAKLQKNGFLFIWVINARYAYALELMEMWGYRLVDDITWVKATVNRRLAKGHGFYLQHAKETCLVGLKGEDPPNLVGNSLPDVIFSERRGQSQKPEEIYSHIETLVPNGKYLEIFARRNNLRNHWVSVGMEL